MVKLIYSFKMGEREAPKETIGKGELYLLSHPGNEEVFSGYGLILREGEKDLLVGLLMVDRPQPADPGWLKRVEETFGEYQLVPMTTTGERGILCRMQVNPESVTHLRKFSTEKAGVLQKALEPLLEHPPQPAFILQWNEEERLWKSQVASNELPKELKEIFQEVGYGCLAIESNIGVIHVCHAADNDIEGFTDKPVSYQWQLIEMPTAPLIRFQLTIFDRPENPYRFEAFWNIAEEDQAETLSQLAAQDQLYLAFYGGDLSYRFTKIVEHDKQQWQYLDELAELAERYWAEIPPDQRDFDKAKAVFMKDFV